MKPMRLEDAMKPAEGESRFFCDCPKFDHGICLITARAMPQRVRMCRYGVEVTKKPTRKRYG